MYLDRYIMDSEKLDTENKIIFHESAIWCQMNQPVFVWTDSL
jgi:hypothetical protein